METIMSARKYLVAALFGALVAAPAAAQPRNSSGEPAPDAKRSGVVNQDSAERPREEMNPHPNYSNTDKKVDQAPVYAPGIDTGRPDGAVPPQKSGETATTPRPLPQR
jgi:hypothetical protein